MAQLERAPRVIIIEVLGSTPRYMTYGIRMIAQLDVGRDRAYHLIMTCVDGDAT